MGCLCIKLVNNFTGISITLNTQVTQRNFIKIKKIETYRNKLCFTKNNYPYRYSLKAWFKHLMRGLS